MDNTPGLAQQCVGTQHVNVIKTDNEYMLCSR